MAAHHIGTVRQTWRHVRTQPALAAIRRNVSGLSAHALPVTAWRGTAFGVKSYADDTEAEDPEERHDEN